MLAKRIDEIYHLNERALPHEYFQNVAKEFLATMENILKLKSEVKQEWEFVEIMELVIFISEQCQRVLPWEEVEREGKN